MRLRPLRLSDEVSAITAHLALKQEDFPFLLGFDEDESWAIYVARKQANSRGEQVAPGWVPSTFLVAIDDGELVGRISIRHELNDWLAAHGGHIGYAVLPERRRLGYATEILRQGLIIARSLGIDDVLIMCDATNIASALTIRACGGELDATVTGEDGETLVQRYWVR